MDEAKGRRPGRKRREIGRRSGRIGGGVDRIGTKGDSRSPTASGLALLYYAERPKTKRQDTSGKPLKSGRKAGDQEKEERMRREGKDDASYDEEEEKDKVMVRRKERVRERRKAERERGEERERDDRLRTTRSVNNTKADCGRG